MNKIGFIGLGIMGRPMSENLMKAGYKLIVFDLNEEVVNDLEKMGAEKGNYPQEVAENADLIITMLPNSPEVKEVVFGDNGLKEGLKEGKIYIDMSSISPLVAKDIAEKLKNRGVECLDAPVSGGEPKAIEGTLAIMVGGPEETFIKCKNILEKMGSNVVRVGGNGSGQTTKLTNQIIVAINIAAMAEGLILGKKAGVDPENIYKAIRGGLAGSAVLDQKAPMVLDRNFNPGFKIDLHIKDLSNVLETSHQLNLPLPLTSAVMEMMQALKVDGCGDNDHGAIAKFYEKIANIEITSG